MSETRCKTHKDLHIARTKDPEKASVCGHQMESGGYALCCDCAETQGRCTLCNALVTD